MCDYCLGPTGYKSRKAVPVPRLCEMQMQARDLSGYIGTVRHGAVCMRTLANPTPQSSATLVLAAGPVLDS